MLIGFSLRGVLQRAGGFVVVAETIVGPVLLIVAAVVIARFLWV